MSQVAIKEIRVEGLHEQYDVALTLNPDLNIIYGRNGRGKTTLLHILANVLELDFDRFSNIQFRSIEIATYQGDTLRILPQVKRIDQPMLLELNGERLTPLHHGIGPSELEISLIRNALGERAVYLPAFRAILERSANDASPSSIERDRYEEYEGIRVSENNISREYLIKSHATYDGRVRGGEQHRLTALKTVQCRQWFGEFVPVIRYPSLVDVRHRLVDEMREATLSTNMFEQRLFSQLFIQVFQAIADETQETESKDTEALLGDVQTALSAIETKSEGSNDVYGQIRKAVDAVRQSHVAETSAVASRILALYAELLGRRSHEHELRYSKIRDFEASVNLFLDGKTLSIEERFDGGRIRGASVVSANGRPMTLSALSSGERQVVTMIFCASRLSANRGIFLVDEPELSLHVDWQRSILGEVMRQAKGRQVIACTHSPEVGADHYDALLEFDPPPSYAPHDLFGDFDSSVEDI